jgi:ribosomal protein S18 acetylase RimI-like enzyme
MKIRKLDTNNRIDRNLFLDFPFQLYKNVPQWIPPLRSDMTFLMDRKRHPFYKHSDGDFLVVESEGSVLGTVAVLKNQIYNQYHHSKTSFFYYLDFIEDFQVASLLLDATTSWAKEHASNLVFGPKGFSRVNGSGMLVEGFQYPGTLGVPYNLSYYPGFLEKAGFTKDVDYFSGYLDRNSHYDPKVYLIADRVRQRDNFWIKTFKNTGEMKKFIPEIERIHDEAFKGIIDFQFYPSTPEEFKMMAKNIIAVADPQIMKMIMRGDEVVGFIIIYPDVSEAVRKIKGRLFPLGWITLLWAKYHTTMLSLNGIGILPKYQGLGSNALLYVETEKVIRGKHYQKAEMIQVQEKNFRSKGDMESLGVQWVKRHRIYHKSIG